MNTVEALATTVPPITLQELDERITSGLRIRLLWSPVSPSKATIEVYEGLDTPHPDLTFQVPGERARDAFLHPYAYASAAGVYPAPATP